MIWEGIPLRDWIILGVLFVLVVVCMIVLVLVYRRKYMNTVTILHSKTMHQIDKYVSAEKETIALIQTMRSRLQDAMKRHEREKHALEEQVHALKNQLHVLTATHVKGDSSQQGEVERVKKQMDELKEKHNAAIEEAEQEIDMLKGQLNALRWRI